MAVVLSIVAALFLLATPCAFVLGVATGRLARERMRREIHTLTERLTRQRSPQPTTFVSVSIGIPIGILLQHTPEANDMREKVVEHWRERSGVDDDEMIM